MANTVAQLGVRRGIWAQLGSSPNLPRDLTPAVPRLDWPNPWAAMGSSAQDVLVLPHVEVFSIAS